VAARKLRGEFGVRELVLVMKGSAPLPSIERHISTLTARGAFRRVANGRYMVVAAVAKAS